MHEFNAKSRKMRELNLNEIKIESLLHNNLMLKPTPTTSVR